MTELNAPYHYNAGYIFLPVPITGLPPTIEVNSVTYQTKLGFRCSLIAVKSIVPLVIARDGLDHDPAEAMVMEAASKIVNELKPVITAIGPELRLADVPERDRHTVIVMVTVPTIEEVFTRLKQELNLEFPTQVPHVTLACVYGLPVGIPSIDDLNKYTRMLTPAEQQQFQSQVDLNKLFGATQ